MRRKGILISDYFLREGKIIRRHNTWHKRCLMPDHGDFSGRFRVQEPG